MHCIWNNIRSSLGSFIFLWQKLKNPTHRSTVPAASIRSLPLMPHAQCISAKLYAEQPLRLQNILKNQRSILCAINFLSLQSARDLSYSMLRTRAQLRSSESWAFPFGQNVSIHFSAPLLRLPTALWLASLFVVLFFFFPLLRCPALFAKGVLTEASRGEASSKGLCRREICGGKTDCRADGRSQTAGDMGGDYGEAGKNRNITLVAGWSPFIYRKLFRNGEKQPLSPTDTRDGSVLSLLFL